MLTNLKFTNFKTWEKADIEFAPVTLLFGTNSSGKSSLIQFVLLLKQTKEATDRALSVDLGGPYVSLGIFRDLVHTHDESRKIDWRLDWKMGTALSIEDSAEQNANVVKSDQLWVSGLLDGSKGKPQARELRYGIGGYCFSLKPRNGESTEKFELLAEGPGRFHFTRQTGRAWPLPGPVKSYAFPDQARTYFQNAGFLADLEAAFEKQIDQVSYLGPLRDYPKREYRWTKARPSGVGQKGESAVEAILAATLAGEKQNLKFKGRLRPFQEIIAHWLREIGLVDEFRVREIAQGSNLWQALLKVAKGAPEVLLTEVGFGLSQVLPVITLLHYAQEGETVILEQPEIHLHPFAQAGLADVIIHVAIHRKVQVIVETHSEHFLYRLQRRIAEGAIAANSTRMYFCRLDNGKSVSEKLNVDLLGNISNWPEGFFGDSFGEIASAEKARLNRQVPA